MVTPTDTEKLRELAEAAGPAWYGAAILALLDELEAARAQALADRAFQAENATLRTRLALYDGHTEEVNRRLGELLAIAAQSRRGEGEE